MAEPAAAPAPGAGHVLAAFVVGQFGVHSAMAGIRLAAPLQTLRDGAGPWSVGLLLALFAAAPVLSAMHAGRLADRLGYHRPVRLAAALTAFGALAALASTFVAGTASFAQLGLAGLASGTGANTGMLTIQRSARLAAGSSVERVRIFSWLGIAPSFANVIGPVAAGFAIGGLGFAAGDGLMLLLPLATLWSARQVPRRPLPAHTPPPPERRAWHLLREPGLRRLLAANWLLSMGWDVHTFAVPVLGHGRGYDAGTIGLVLGTFTLSVTAVRLVIPLLAHRLHEVAVVRVARVGTGAVFALYPLAPDPWRMGLCAFGLGLTLGSVQPMVMSMLHHVTPEGRHGEALALRSMAINTSSTRMPLVFGATGALMGAAVLFWVVGALVAGGAWPARRLRAAAR